MVKKKKYRIYKLEELNRNDFTLLKQSYFLYRNNTEEFVCFGPSYFKLRQLELIDDDNQITFHGRSLVKYVMYHLDN